MAANGKSKQLSSKSFPMVHPPKGKMHTSMVPKGTGASVPGWTGAAKAKSGLLKAKPR